MNLPERLYYPLPEAADKLGCSVKDIYHFATVGMLNISVFIPSLYNDDLFVEVPEHMIGNIGNEFNEMIMGDKWYINGVSKETNELGLYVASSICGFFYLQSDVFQLHEFTGESEVFKTVSFLTHPERHDDCSNITLSSGAMELDGRYLCIMSEDLRNIGEVGRFPLSVNNSVSRTIGNNQAALIKALIAIHYGEDVANSPRKFIENKDSEICKDFNLKGMKIPSGKRVSDWLKNVDIDFFP